MSAASTPAPRAKSPTDTRPSSSRHSLFVPMFILLLGIGALTCYQLMAMEEQLDQMTQTADKLDPKVKLAQYERAKFFQMAREVLKLAPRDPNADSVVVLFNLRKLQVEQPELMNASATSDIPTTNNTPAPQMPSTSTNAAPVDATHPASPAAK